MNSSLGLNSANLSNEEATHNPIPSPICSPVRSQFVIQFNKVLHSDYAREFLPVCFFVSLSLCLFASLSLCLFLPFSLCLSVSVSLSLSLCLFIPLSLRHNVSLLLWPFVCLFVCFWCKSNVFSPKCSSFSLNRRRTGQIIWYYIRHWWTKYSKKRIQDTEMAQTHTDFL